MVKSQKAITDEQKKKAEQHSKTCIGKIGVSEDDVIKVIGGDFSVTDKKIEVRIITTTLKQTKL